MQSNGACKIGISSDPEARLKQIGAPAIQLLHFFEADDAFRAESILHKTYQNKKLDKEWFRLSICDIEDIEFIAGFKDGEFYHESRD